MEITLFDQKRELADAWRDEMVVGLGVTIQVADLSAITADVIVSPANSFGFMDGGFDWALRRLLGFSIEDRVRDAVRGCAMRELVVGDARLVETGHKRIKYIIVAPTMRVPMVLPKDTVNPYLATKAAIACARYSGIQSLAIPGMGTGVGGMSPAVCARQMKAAILEVHGLGHGPENQWEAQVAHQRLYSDASPIDLQGVK